MVWGGVPAPFFSVIVISIDVKKKALKILALGLILQHKQFFDWIICHWIISQSWDAKLILVCQKRFCTRRNNWKIMYYTIFGWHPWMFKYRHPPGTYLSVFLPALLKHQTCYFKSLDGPLELNNESTMRLCQCVLTIACNFLSNWGQDVAFLSRFSCIVYICVLQSTWILATLNWDCQFNVAKTFYTIFYGSHH